MKIVQNALFRSCAARFGQLAFLSVKVVKSSHGPEILSKKGKLCAFHQNCTKHSFQVMRSTFSPNRILERQSCQNRHTGLKFSPKRGNSAVFMKIVQIALFRSRTARFGQIAFFKGQTSQNRYTCPKFSSKREHSLLFQTLFSGHAQHVSAKSHF